MNAGLTPGWWADAVVYQIYPRSFLARSAHGEGDLAGVMKGLPQLAELGVDALWLSPFYPSPMHDSGYDVSDHRAIDPRYGTLDDFDALIEAAHGLGIRVLVDLVPNHVSTDHPWFQAALAAPRNSRERARFHFADGRGTDGSRPPTNWCSVFTGSAWTRVAESDGTPGQWYLHLFDASQPDLNWDHAEVRSDFLGTIAFWLDRGVDGFRVDVAMGMAKDMAHGDATDPVALTDAMRLDLFDGSPAAYARRDLMAGSPIFDVDGVHEILREWRALLDSRGSDLLTVGEAWTHPPERARRYTRPDELRQLFNFDFLVTPWDADRLAAAIAETLAGDAQGSPANWALDNHDTPRVATRLGGGPRGLERARALAMLVLALPGTVYLYQGQELGLDDVDVPAGSRQDPVFLRSGGEQVGRDGGRVPLPWSGEEPPYGFAPAGTLTWLPQPSDWASVTRAAQEGDPESTLALYRRALAERRARRVEWRAAGTDVGVSGGLLVVHRGRGFTSVTNCADSDVPWHEGGLVVLSSSPGDGFGAVPTTIPARSTVWLEPQQE